MDRLSYLLGFTFTFYVGRSITRRRLRDMGEKTLTNTRKDFGQGMDTTRGHFTVHPTHRAVLFFFNIHFSPSTGPGRREGQDVAPGLQRGRGPARDPRAPFECGTTNSLVGKAGSELEKKEILKERRRMSQNDAITRLDPRETIIMNRRDESRSRAQGIPVFRTLKLNRSRNSENLKKKFTP
ncbi:hypothetical protein KQX54_011872 [Cotesia glomerata]|uniref:Uncharacterized protein n=1 Tax=Cotesia glomerata TaxID=32391 RepID=A0AAV7J9H8_COTGL|nr:hypothetical protein KQX54_011872 [Cotesia glomerata]